MTLDWTAMGLQVVNVLILVWLLSRLFWRPVAAAIAARQDAAQAMLQDAATAKAEAEAVKLEVTRTRAGMAAERDRLLSKAQTAAAAATKAAIAEAAERAEDARKAAQAKQVREAETEQATVRAASAELAVDIARKLLARLDTDTVQAAFLGQLVEAIAQLSKSDRAALAATAGRIDLVSAAELDADERAKITQAVGAALGGDAALTFITDPELVAGFELRTAHFILRDSWRADLDTVLKDLRDAA